MLVDTRLREILHRVSSSVTCSCDYSITPVRGWAKFRFRSTNQNGSPSPDWCCTLSRNSPTLLHLVPTNAMDMKELDWFADPLLAVPPIDGGFDSAEQIPSNRSSNSFSSDPCVSAVAPTPTKTMHREGKPDESQGHSLPTNNNTTVEKQIQIMATGQKSAPSMFI